MKTIVFEQGSQEWHDWRINGIGASDAPVIMGVSPWKTPYQLWLEKTGQSESSKPQTRWQKRGLDLEEKARHKYMKESGNHVMPLCGEHDDLTWLHASFDGITLNEDLIVEIKCPGQKDHQIALDGCIPTKYYPQLQHQMLVANCNEAHYYSFDGEEGVLIEVKADHGYQSTLMHKLVDFWQRVVTKLEPEITESDHVFIDSSDFAFAAEKWKKAQTDLELAKKNEKEARDLLLSQTDDGNCFGFGVKCTRINRQGGVDYSAIPELKEIDLDKYRKPSIGYWKIQAYEA